MFNLLSTQKQQNHVFKKQFIKFTAVCGLLTEHLSRSIYSLAI